MIFFKGQIGARPRSVLVGFEGFVSVVISTGRREWRNLGGLVRMEDLSTTACGLRLR